MKVARYQTYQIKPRYLLVKIETNTGIVGWGEATLEGKARTVEMAVKEFMEIVMGEDPRRVEHLWQRMYRGSFYRGGPILCSAISGIEQALWDIKGKALGAPVYDLLGGKVREKVLVYRGAGGANYDTAKVSVEAAKAAGFAAVKAAPWSATRVVDTPAKVEQAVEMIRGMRDGGGKDFMIGVDGHGRLSPAMAIQFARALEPFGLMFFEEPCLPENVDEMARIAQMTSIPIATGERLFTRWGFRQVLEKHAASVVQPDLSHCGGIFEARKIAAMAEMYYAGVAPHCPLSVVAFAAAMQVDACIPNFLIQEHTTWGGDLLKKPFKLEDGYVAVPTGPGLGIEVDEAKVKARVYDGSWQTPEWEHPDGSFADW